MLFVLEILTGLLALAMVLPHVPVAHGIVRIADFPRQQIVAVAAALLIGSVFVEAGLARTIVQLVLGAVMLVQIGFILPFTPLWQRQSADYDPERDADGRPFRLISCNVKQANDRYSALDRIISAQEPDIVVLMEIDQIWLDALDKTLSSFAHVVRQPRDNSYGMVLASRFPLTDVEVADLLTEGVPSIRATVSLSDELEFRLYAIHPEPPVPSHGSVGRDGETGLIALMARDESLPVLVTGDLNDVAWSGTTHRFRRISRLLDPRFGRKIFSTFDARYPPMRWPLDHLFHSPHFRLKAMTRLPPCGSDHFPVMFDLVLCRDSLALNMPEREDEEDIARARELAGKARENEDSPVGADWER